MTKEIDDALDALLREQFDGPVPDDGFCLTVMDRLPARRRHGNWPMVAGISAGVALCWLTLWFSPIANAGWRDWLSGEPSASALALLIAMTGLAVLTLAWTIAEATDHGAQTL
jgi:hypothetical protein